MSIPSKGSSKLIVFFCISKPSNRSINNFRVLILSKSSRIDKISYDLFVIKAVGHKTVISQALVGYHCY